MFAAGGTTVLRGPAAPLSERIRKLFKIGTLVTISVRRIKFASLWPPVAPTRPVFAAAHKVLPRRIRAARRHRSRPQIGGLRKESVRYRATRGGRTRWDEDPVSADDPILIDAVVPASGKKESNAACHVRLNLRTHLLELLAEQRSQQRGEEDHILEESRRCCQELRDERR